MIALRPDFDNSVTLPEVVHRPDQAFPGIVTGKYQWLPLKIFTKRGAAVFLWPAAMLMMALTERWKRHGRDGTARADKTSAGRRSSADPRQSEIAAVRVSRHRGDRRGQRRARGARAGRQAPSRRRA